MLASAAVLLPPGDQEALEGLDLHNAGPLDHETVDTQPVQQFTKEQRIGDQKAVPAADLARTASLDSGCRGFPVRRCAAAFRSQCSRGKAFSVSR